MADNRGYKGNGTISKTPSNTYKLRFFIGYNQDGTPNRFIKTFKTRREAVAKQHQLIEAKRNNALTVPSTCILSEYINRRYLLLKRQQVKPSTYTDYLSIINNHIIPDLGFYSIQQINISIIDSFLMDKRKALSDGTVLKIKNVLSSIFSLANKEQIILSNPVTNSNIKPKAADRRDNILTDNDIQLILNKATEWSKSKRYGSNKLLADIFYTAYNTGARIGEILALDFTDINASNNTITINKTLSEVNKAVSNNAQSIEVTTPKTQNANRVILVSPAVIQRLLKLRDNINTNHVFHTRTGNYFAISNVARSWRALLEELNISYHIHDIRHTAISNAVNNGVDILNVSRWAGHANISTTANIYCTHDIKNQQNIVDVLSKKI